MYEYKVFQADASSIASLNELVERITKEGWEPVQVWPYVPMALMQVLARRSKTLND